MSTTPELKAHLDNAVDRFYEAWTTGDWDGYFALFAADFTFEFPVGPFVGRWSGAEAREKRDEWRATYEKSSRLSAVNEDLRLYDGHWVVVCDHGEGVIDGKPYQGVETIMMRVDDDGRIVEYREFLGGLGAA